MKKEYLSQYFYYDPSSPSCLRWKVWNGQTNHSKRNSGDVAGYISTPDIGNPDYRRYKVCLDNREYLAHRVILVLHDIDPSNLTVNHINCNSLDNRIENLEVCTSRENNIRKKSHTLNIMQTNNTSGVLGVRETVVVRPSGKIDYYAHAFTRYGGKCLQKKFNYAKYGKEKAWQLAKEFRENTFKDSL